MSVSQMFFDQKIRNPLVVKHTKKSFMKLDTDPLPTLSVQRLMLVELSNSESIDSLKTSYDYLKFNIIFRKSVI
jgi:hypothetical protein